MKFYFCFWVLIRLDLKMILLYKSFDFCGQNGQCGSIRANETLTLRGIWVWNKSKSHQKWGLPRSYIPEQTARSRVTLQYVSKIFIEIMKIGLNWWNHKNRNFEFLELIRPETRQLLVLDFSIFGKRILIATNP